MVQGPACLWIGCNLVINYCKCDEILKKCRTSAQEGQLQYLVHWHSGKVCNYSKRSWSTPIVCNLDYIAEQSKAIGGWMDVSWELGFVEIFARDDFGLLLRHCSCSSVHNYKADSKIVEKLNRTLFSRICEATRRFAWILLMIVFTVFQEAVQSYISFLWE